RSDLEKKEAVTYDAGIGGAQWSPDSKELLFQYKGRTWLVNPDGSDLHPIVDGASAIVSPTYSQDSRDLGYTNGTNLFRLDRKTGAVKQLTFVSKPNTSVDGFEWSADSKSIAVTWSDSSKTGHHVMMDFSKDRATVVNTQREWNGDQDIDAQVG